MKFKTNKEIFKGKSAIVDDVQRRLKTKHIESVLNAGVNDSINRIQEAERLCEDNPRYQLANALSDVQQGNLGLNSVGRIYGENVQRTVEDVLEEKSDANHSTFFKIVKKNMTDYKTLDSLFDIQDAVLVGTERDRSNVRNNFDSRIKSKDISPKDVALLAYAALDQESVDGLISDGRNMEYLENNLTEYMGVGSENVRPVMLSYAVHVLRETPEKLKSAATKYGLEKELQESVLGALNQECFELDCDPQFVIPYIRDFEVPEDKAVELIQKAEMPLIYELSQAICTEPSLSEKYTPVLEKGLVYGILAGDEVTPLLDRLGYDASNLPNNIKDELTKGSADWDNNIVEDFSKEYNLEKE